MSIFALMLRQHLKGGGVGLLLAALILAVTASTTLRFAADTVQDAVTQQAGQLLAADVVVSAPDPLPDVWQSRAQQAQMRHTEVVSFASMAQANEQFALVNVKAVETGYPLRGSLRTAPSLPSGVPQQGTVWLEPRLLALLQLKLGDRLSLGETTLTVAATLERDPNRETGISGFSPTIMMNRADVAATQAIQVGSRVDYRVLLAGTPQQVEQFVAQYEKKLPQGVRLRSAQEGNTRLMRPINLLTDYAQVASILTLLLCGIAVSLSTRRMTDQQLDQLALLRCLGASQRQLISIYAQLLLGVWLLASVVGAVLGVLGAVALLQVLSHALPALELPLVALDVVSPWLTAVLTALIMLVGFALPSFWRLLGVSPLRVLRAELQPASWSTLGVVAIAWGSLFAFVLLQTGKWGLSLSLLFGVSLLLLVLLGGVWAVLRILAQRGIATEHLSRQPLMSSVRIVSLALGLGLVGVVLLLRQDLLERWQASLPVGTPNQFVYGLPPDQKQAFEQTLKGQAWPHSPLYPNVKGRLTGKNGQPFTGEAAQDNSLKRELNLTMSNALPADNVILAGQALTAPNQVSVEEGVAERLGIQLGDTLNMQLPEGKLDAKVVSIRTVDWDNFRPNFFFIYSEGSLDPNAGSYLGSFYVAPAQRDQLTQVIQQFPTALLIDVDAILAEIRQLLNWLGQGLGLLALLVGLAGLCVLLASLRLMVDERQNEAALLRALGISQVQLRQRLLGEMVLLGSSAGILAVVVAEGIGLVLAWRFELPMQLHLWWWLAAPISLIGLALLVAYPTLRPLWQQSPLQILRQLSHS